MRFPFNQPERSLRARVGGSAALLVIGGALALASDDWRQGALFALGGIGGALLYVTGFAFMGGWKDAIVRRDVAGIEAQIVMVGASVLLFAAFALGRGAALGLPMAGAAAPLGLAVAVGGALFGVGLAFMGDGLALAAALFAAVAGAWLAGLTPDVWARLPSVGPVMLPALVRWKGAAPIQFGVLILLWTFARMWAGTTARRPVRPLVAPALALATLGWLVLMVSDTPWHLVPFATAWRMDLAVALGAIAAASLVRGATGSVPIGRALPIAVAGGLVAGYGAGIAGTPLEAMIAAVASGSLSGWLWLASAFGAAILGIRLRRALG